jgi:hypothetical protein
LELDLEFRLQCNTCRSAILQQIIWTLWFERPKQCQEDFTMKFLRNLIQLSTNRWEYFV